MQAVAGRAGERGGGGGGGGGWRRYLQGITAVHNCIVLWLNSSMQFKRATDVQNRSL